MSSDIDIDLLEEVIEWQCKHFKDNTDTTELDVNEASLWIKETMTQASDTAMRRVKMPQKKKQVHWWNSEIKKDRTLCI